MNEKIKTLEIVFITANNKYTTGELLSTEQTHKLLANVVENNIDAHLGAILSIFKSSDVITVSIDTSGFSLARRAALDIRLREIVAHFTTYFSAPSFTSKVKRVADDQFMMAVYDRKSNTKLTCSATDLFELTDTSLKLIVHQGNEYVSTGTVNGKYYLISRYTDDIMILGETIEFREDEGVYTLMCGNTTHSYDTQGLQLSSDLPVTLHASKTN